MFVVKIDWVGNVVFFGKDWRELGEVLVDGMFMFGIVIV